MTQNELAERLGVTQSSISQFEHSEQTLKLGTLRSIGAAMGCTVRIQFIDESTGDTVGRMSLED